MDVKWFRSSLLCAVSHVGARTHNEDFFAVQKLPDGFYIAVADGMGGHAAGEVASRIAVESAVEVVNGLYSAGMEERDVRLLLRLAHEIANGRVLEEAREDRLDIFRHPASNRLVHAIGVGGRRFAVGLYTWESLPGEMLLLSTDGLHDYVREREIVETVRISREPCEAVEGLLKTALPVTRDNVTIAAVRWP